MPEPLGHWAVIQGLRVQVPPLPLALFFVSSLEFKSLATLVKQPTGLHPTVTFKLNCSMYDKRKDASKFKQLSSGHEYQGSMCSI